MASLSKELAPECEPIYISNFDFDFDFEIAQRPPEDLPGPGRGDSGRSASPHQAGFAISASFAFALSGLLAQQGTR